MAYTVLRVQVSGWRDRFKEADVDSDFSVQAYPELDNFLSMMEERGWTVIDTEVFVNVNTMIYITLHQPNPESGPE